MLQLIDDNKPINVREVVEELRMARNFMVQTFVQYAFVYRTVLDRLRTILGEVGAEIQKRQAAQHAEAARRAEEAAKKAAEAARIAAEKAKLQVRVTASSM